MMTNKKSLVFTPTSLTQKIILFISMTLFYCLTSYLGTKFSPLHHSYPSSAVAIGMLLIFGNRNFLAIFSGALIAQLSRGTPFIGAISIAIGITLGAIIGSSVIDALLNKPALKHYNESLALIIGSAISAIFSSFIGVFTLLQLDQINASAFSQQLLSWWSSSFIASIIILPLILNMEVMFQQKTWKSLLNFNKIIIFIILNISGLIFLTFVFHHNYNQAYAWFFCLPLLFSGLYLGNIFSRLTLVIFSFGIMLLCMNRFGSFDYGNNDLNVLYIYTLLFGYAISTLLSVPMKSKLTLNKIYIASMIISWAIICAVIYITSAKEQETIKKDFSNIVEKTIEGINESIADTDDLLDGASGLIIAKPDISLPAWKEYINSYTISKTFSLVNGLGVIRSNDKQEVTFYESRYPTQITPGLNLGSDPALETAANQARKFNYTVASKNTSLLHNKKIYNSFILFHPIKTSESSKKDFLGWIFSPVITEHFFQKSLALNKDILFMHVSEDDKEIYCSEFCQHTKLNTPSLSLNKHVEIFSNILSIDFYPKAEFFFSHNSFIVPVSGLIVSIYFLFVCFLVELFTFGIRAEQLVVERTKEINETKEKLLASEKMAYYGEVAAGMAHEINNPLTIINGKLQKLLMQSKDPAVRTDIEKILFNTDRISLIISGLRKFAGHTEKSLFELVSCHSFINKSLKLCEEIIAKNKIEIKLDLSEEVFVNCNTAQLSQVFFHLINNACDAIAKLENRWIQLDTLKTDHKTIQIIVTDSGNGIPAEIADKLMQPFFTTKEVGIGKGIDLSISHGIILDHKGTLTLDRNFPHTRFIIELPI
jgi:signal transduction histidine kinase/integral membrane sensor domain MASE1